MWHIPSSATAAEASSSTQPLWSRLNIPQDYSTELVHSSQYPTPPKQCHHPGIENTCDTAQNGSDMFNDVKSHILSITSNPIRKAPGADVFHQRKLLEMPPRCCFLVVLETALETAPPSRARAELRCRRMSWYQDGGAAFS